MPDYRLGDAVYGILEPQEKEQLKVDFPNSIGGKFLKGDDHTMRGLSNTISSHCKTVPLPNDLNTLVHLRLGDVLCGTSSHERGKRPVTVKRLKETVKTVGKNDEKVYVVGKSFNAATSTATCAKESKM